MNNIKKIASIVSKILTIILLIFTLAMMAFTVFSAITFDRNERGLFGYGFYIVQSESMEINKDEEMEELNVHKINFAKDDLIIVKRLSDEKKQSLKIGDVITFTSTNPDASFGQTVTHMIYDIVKAKDKETGIEEVVGYKTVGSANGMIAKDQATVYLNHIYGQYKTQLPTVGHFFAFMKTTPGYIVCILIPFLLLIIYNGLNCVRIFRQYKSEQRAEIQAERDEIEKERQQNAEMLRQLQALQAQISAQMQISADTKEKAEDSQKDS
jgi:signal peptidase I